MYFKTLTDITHKYMSENHSPHYIRILVWNGETEHIYMYFSSACILYKKKSQNQDCNARPAGF